MIDREPYTPGPARGGKIQKDGEQWTLVLVRELRHPPEKVWLALTDAGPEDSGQASSAMIKAVAWSKRKLTSSIVRYGGPGGEAVGLKVHPKMTISAMTTTIGNSPDTQIRVVSPLCVGRTVLSGCDPR
jgi:hypothetical protein